MADKPFRYFICPECDPHKEIQPKDFLNHLKDVHGITEKKGIRTLVMHARRPPRGYYQFEWNIGDKKFFEHRG